METYSIINIINKNSNNISKTSGFNRNVLQFVNNSEWITNKNQFRRVIRHYYSEFDLLNIIAGNLLEFSVWLQDNPYWRNIADKLV